MSAARLLLLAAAAAALLPLAEGAAAPPALAALAGRYAPPAVVGQPGDSILFVNGDTVPHTVTADAGGFNTGAVAPGGSATFRLPAAGGLHGFHCSFHPLTMQGSAFVLSPG